MPCILILLACLAGAYIFAQTSTLRKLIRLFRRPGRRVQGSLAINCIVTLCVLPGLALLILTGIVWILKSISGDGWDIKDPLILLTLSPYGDLFALCSWVAMTGWFCMIIARPRSLYRGPLSLVPMVILSLICLTFSLGVGWVVARGILQNFSLITGQASWEQLVVGLILGFVFYVPTAPLVGFVLLIIHVARMLPSSGGVTMEASGNESQSEGDMP